MTFSYTWWQQGLRMLSNVLLGLGVAGLLAAGASAVRRRPFRKLRPGQLGLVSLGVLALGGTSSWLLRHVVEPSGSVVTKRRFDSSTNPALAVMAPEGWRIEFEDSSASLLVIKGERAVQEAPVTLLIQSALLSDEVVLDRLVAETAKVLSATQAWRPEPAFHDRIAGAEARGFVVEGPAGSMSTWAVHRGGRLVSTVQCFARDGSDARFACREVLARLQWRDPA